MIANISAEQIAYSLEMPRKIGADRYMVRCVAHEDRTPSLAITQSGDTVLLKCFAGCPQDAVIDGLLARGLWRDGQKRNPSGIVRSVRKRNSAKTEHSTTYSYALQLWQNADDEGDIASQSYAVRKGIKHAAGVARGTASGSLIGKGADCLIVPMRTLDGDLVGVECINPDGVKQTFGNKGVLILGNDLDPQLPQLVVEGWATAVAILDLYDWNACVYACFGKSMLERYAQEIATEYPHRKIIIVGECDE